MNRQQLYTAIWEKALPDIIDLLETFPYHGSKELPSSDFKKVCDREDYSFNLQINYGTLVNNMDGSAIAQDLADVFWGDIRAKIISHDKKINIRLDKNFTLHLSSTK